MIFPDQFYNDLDTDTFCIVAVGAEGTPHTEKLFIALRQSKQRNAGFRDVPLYDIGWIETNWIDNKTGVISQYDATQELEDGDDKPLLGNFNGAIVKLRFFDFETAQNHTGIVLDNALPLSNARALDDATMLTGVDRSTLDAVLKVSMLVAAKRSFEANFQRAVGLCSFTLAQASEYRADHPLITLKTPAGPC